MLAAYAFELFFITVFYLSRLIGPGTGGDKVIDNAASNCQCLAVTTHRCAGGARECRCSAVMVHSDNCGTLLHEHGRSVIETHNWAMRETTPTFLDTAIFFTLSVAIGIDATGFSRRITNYEIRVLAYVSVLVASPLYTVLALSLGTLRRNLTSLVVILLCIGVAAPAFTVNSGGDRWGSICFSDTIMFMIARTTMASFFGAIFLACELCRLLLGPIQRAAQGSRREFLNQMS